MIDYTWVSMPAILRDWTDKLKYKNKEHQQLVDIADSLYNVGINPKEFKADYKSLYDKYGKEYFDKVLDDMRALDSQLTDFDKAHELAADYYDRVGDANYSEDWYGESYKAERYDPYFDADIDTSDFTPQTPVKLKDLKNGEYFTLKDIPQPKDSQVWVKGEYDKYDREWVCYKFSDVNQGKGFKGDKLVYTDFIF